MGAVKTAAILGTVLGMAGAIKASSSSGENKDGWARRNKKERRKKNKSARKHRKFNLMKTKR